MLACVSQRDDAERLDAVVWQALEQLLRNPSVIPQLHQTWAAAKRQTLSGLEAQQGQLLQRRQRIERQDQRLLDAYQAEIITLREIQMRRQKLAATLHQIEQESRQLVHTRQQSVQWQQVIDNATTFRQLLGTNLAQLSFEERQAIAQCLISKVVVTGEEVDVHFLLPFDSTPQVAQHIGKAPGGAPGHFYRLRLAHFHAPAHPHRAFAPVKRLFQLRTVLDHPPVNGGVIHMDTALEHEFFDVARAQRVATYHRTPVRMLSCGKWAPWKLTAIVSLPFLAYGSRRESIPQIASKENCDRTRFCAATNCDKLSDSPW